METCVQKLRSSLNARYVTQHVFPVPRSRLGVDCHAFHFHSSYTCTRRAFAMLDVDGLIPVTSALRAGGDVFPWRKQ
jgi:hypothetical protein